jgi:hypothetical protein
MRGGCRRQRHRRWSDKIMTRLTWRKRRFVDRAGHAAVHDPDDGSKRCLYPLFIRALSSISPDVAAMEASDAREPGSTAPSRERAVQKRSRCDWAKVAPHWGEAGAARPECGVLPTAGGGRGVRSGGE